mmetsp:Transcript_45769/g.103122  ORF Transcript_45769/g.103122 Transcript_45769/m.103122 type:complete len:212 (+) Transcript_45769:921-1556(+)
MSDETRGWWKGRGRERCRLEGEGKEEGDRVQAARLGRSVDAHEDSAAVPQLKTGCGRAHAVGERDAIGDQLRDLEVVTPLGLAQLDLELARLLLDLDRLKTMEEDERADEKERDEEESTRHIGDVGCESTERLARLADQLDQLRHTARHYLQARTAKPVGCFGCRLRSSSGARPSVGAWLLGDISEPSAPEGAAWLVACHALCTSSRPGAS